MIRRILTFMIVIILIITVFCGFSISREQKELSSKLIRLHVVANSDTEEDQKLKLKVRDEILDAIGPRLKNIGDRKNAEVFIREKLDGISDLSETVIKNEGYEYTAKVSLETENYPAAEYDTFRLPSGKYMSLRVMIGEGKGHNWWCVVFPPVCTAGSAEAIETAAPELTEGEVSLITSDDGGYVIKFRIMELIGRLRAYFEI